MKAQLKAKRKTSEKSLKKKLVADRINTITIDLQRLTRRGASFLKDVVIETFIREIPEPLFAILKSRRRRRSAMIGIEKEVLKPKPKPKR